MLAAVNLVGNADTAAAAAGMPAGIVCGMWGPAERLGALLGMVRSHVEAGPVNSAPNPFGGFSLRGALKTTKWRVVWWFRSGSVPKSTKRPERPRGAAPRIRARLRPQGRVDAQYIKQVIY